MSASVLPFSPSQAAELASDDHRKREATARALCCLRGIVLKIVRMPDGQAVYAAGFHRFTRLEQLEDWLESLGYLE